MPVTLQSGGIKFKDSNNNFIAMNSIKGDQGIPGDPTLLIDDTAGSGETEKTWSANKILSTIPSVPVTDVQINGTSILSSGVASIPFATYDGGYGIIKAKGAGIAVSDSSHGLYISRATAGNIKIGTDQYNPIVPYNQEVSVFYGLAKAAGDSSQSSSSNAVGTYTNNAKAAINTMIGSVSKIELGNAGITAKSYTTKFGGEFTVTTAVDQDYISPHALASVTGRILKEYAYRITFNETVYELPQRMWFTRVDGGFKVYEYLGNLNLYVSNINGVANGTDNVPFIIISDLDNNGSIDVLTEVAGTYTIKIEQINYTKTKLPNSLIYGNEYVPFEKVINSGSSYDGFSVGINSFLNIRGPIALGYCNTMRNQFTTAIGLGNDVAGNDSVAIGYDNTLTDIGLAIGTSNSVSGSNAVAIGLDLTANGSGMVALGAHNYPANTTFPSFQANTVYKKGDIVVGKWLSIMPDMVWMCTTTHTSANVTYIANDTDENQIAYWSLAPSTGDTLLAVGNGTNMQNSNAMKIDIVGNTFIGGDIYTNCNNDSTGGTMLPKDIQINGTSIVSNGVANIPLAGTNRLGVIKLAQTAQAHGLTIADSGSIYTEKASDANIQAGTNNNAVIVPSNQHKSIFYGLAKAAGDTTQSSSSNAIGTYTDGAKAAIQTMLGIDKGVELVETISGTTPSITGQPNIIYKCGEILTLNITPPANGTIDVYFTSGSTATTLTVPNTVKFPGWFNPSALDTSTIYEIMITDGVYGSVMAWPS